MKTIICQHCGKVAGTIGIGRTPTNLNVTDIYDTLRACKNVPATAEKLKCSRGLVYKILKNNKLTPEKVLRG